MLYIKHAVVNIQSTGLGICIEPINDYLNYTCEMLCCDKSY